MKTKQLDPNGRNMKYMGINPNTKKTKIYLYAESKTTGEAQWYESKGVFTQNTALSYFYKGQYSVVFAQGIQRSEKKGWC